MNNKLTYNLINFLDNNKIEFNFPSIEATKDENGNHIEYELDNNYSVSVKKKINLNFISVSNILTEKYKNKHLSAEDVIHSDILEKLIEFELIHTHSDIINSELYSEIQLAAINEDIADQEEKDKFIIEYNYSDFAEQFGYFLAEKYKGGFTKEKQYGSDING